MSKSVLPSVIIKGVGSYVPSHVLTNDDLSKIVETSDEWIRTRTGIRERHIAKDENTSDMAVAAAREAIENAGLTPENIDLIVVGTITGDLSFPSTACLTQAKLGLNNIPCFDLQAACSGFVYGLDVAKGLLLSNPQYKNVLVIGAEKLSAVTDWEDRTTCVLFGDGAGAAVLGLDDEPGWGIVASKTGADGSAKEILYIPSGGTESPPTVETVEKKEHFIRMQGNQVFKIAVRAMAQCAVDVLSQQGLTKDDIDWVVPHQANQRIIDALSNRLEIPLEQFKVNLDRFGNTSAASIPLALTEAVKDGQIKSGDYVLLVAFGAGLTWGASLIKWK